MMQLLLEELGRPVMVETTVAKIILKRARTACIRWEAD